MKLVYIYVIIFNPIFDLCVPIVLSEFNFCLKRPLYENLSVEPLQLKDTLGITAK